MTRIVVLLAVATLTGCAPRPYTLECLGPGAGLTGAQCEDLADLVLAEAPGRRLGSLTNVAVEPIPCSRRLARATLQPEIAAAQSCWGVLLQYAGAELHRWVVRMDDGRVTVLR